MYKGLHNFKVNVETYGLGEKFSLSWYTGKGKKSVRWHVWLNRNWDVLPSLSRHPYTFPTLYKRVGDRDVRYLNATAKANTDMVATATAWASRAGMLYTADKVLRQKEEDEQAKNRAEADVAHVEKTGPIMLKAIRYVLANAEGDLYHTDQQSGETFEQILEMAMRQAEGRPNRDWKHVVKFL